MPLILGAVDGFWMGTLEILGDNDGKLEGVVTVLFIEQYKSLDGSRSNVLV